MEYSGHLLNNIAQFAALLRRAGLDVSLSDSLKACETLAHIPVGERDQIHAGLKASLIRRPEDHEVFDQIFQMFFRDPDLFERLLSPLMPQRPGDKDDRRPPPKRRVQDAFARQRHVDEPEEPELEADREGSASLMELLGEKDFEQMSADEFRLAMQAIHDLMLHLPRLDSRRRQVALKGKADFARSLRAHMRQPFQMGQLVHTQKRQE
jgi:Protein containing von Willebrand factor type A (vWA) domain